jgi:hypothetical protein
MTDTETALALISEVHALIKLTNYDKALGKARGLEKLDFDKRLPEVKNNLRSILLCMDTPIVRDKQGVPELRHVLGVVMYSIPLVANSTGSPDYSLATEAWLVWNPFTGKPIGGQSIALSKLEDGSTEPSVQPPTSQSFTFSIASPPL